MLVGKAVARTVQAPCRVAFGTLPWSAAFLLGMTALLTSRRRISARVRISTHHCLSFCDIVSGGSPSKERTVWWVGYCVIPRHESMAGWCRASG